MNGGYTWNRESDQCPESLDYKWEWYNGTSMVLDASASMTCVFSSKTDLKGPLHSRHCCEKLVFESTEAISDSIKRNTLGSYDYHGKGENGTHVYKHTDTDNYL